MSQPVEGLERAGYSPKEFARLANIGEATIYRWIKSGEVKALRLGPRLLLIPMGEVERLLGQEREVTV